jgi:hypothetical protein
MDVKRNTVTGTARIYESERTRKIPSATTEEKYRMSWEK